MAKFHLYPEVEYHCYCTAFHKTHSYWITFVQNVYTQFDDNL
jgi:hypothetical protein